MLSLSKHWAGFFSSLLEKWKAGNRELKIQGNLPRGRCVTVHPFCLASAINASLKHSGNSGQTSTRL